MSKYWLVLILSLSFLFSCTDENKNISTYTVSNKNFENILSIDGFVEPVQSTTLVCPRNAEGVVVSLVEDGTYVEEGEIVCVIEDPNMQTDYDQLQVDLENARAVLSKTTADLDLQYAMLDAQVQSNEAETKIAQLDSLQLQYSTQTQQKIKELGLEKVAIQKAKLEKKLKSLAIIQQSELRRRELNIVRLSSRVQAAKEQLEKLTIKAPVTGLALRANYVITGDAKLQTGDPVWGNVPLVVIPELSKMKVKIMASEKDFKYINEGDSVIYTFDAMPENRAWGKILKKAPVGQQIKRDSKVKTFEIEATIDSTLTVPEPGITVSCRIILKQVKDTIIVPQVAIFEEDSIKVVYVKRAKGYEMRQILTGLSSPKEAIVTDGLNRKEVIALTKPTPSAIRERTLLPVSGAKQANKTNRNR
ncbi:efflux RND transporter periplasmic adaptor subunit [Viscerimonas tarda]